MPLAWNIFLKNPGPWPSNERLEVLLTINLVNKRLVKIEIKKKQTLSYSLALVFSSFLSLPLFTPFTLVTVGVDKTCGFLYLLFYSIFVEWPLIAPSCPSTRSTCSVPQILLKSRVKCIIMSIEFQPNSQKSMKSTNPQNLYSDIFSRHEKQITINTSLNVKIFGLCSVTL